MRNVIRVAGLTISLFAVSACGTGGDAADPDITSTTGAPATTEAPTTSLLEPATTSSTTVPSTTVPSSTVPSTTVNGSSGADTEPPPAPTNVTCTAGGGSQEVMLEWDAPTDPDDVVDVRLYVNDGSGFARVSKFTVESGQVLIGSYRWSAVAYPVPLDTEIQMAVTLGDAAGNESGWNPIDVYSEYSGADCVS